MARLAKQLYYTAKGEHKINCYKVNIPKKIVKQTNITDKDDIEIYAEKNKIIIERAIKIERKN